MAASKMAMNDIHCCDLDTAALGPFPGIAGGYPSKMAADDIGCCSHRVLSSALQCLASAIPSKMAANEIRYQVEGLLT